MGFFRLKRDLFLLGVGGLIAVITINAYVVIQAKPYRVSFGEVTQKQVVIIPGAGAKGGVPSDVFRDRLETGAELYHEGMVEKILVSGDHGTKGYDEVNTARLFLLDKGVLPEHIFLDHAGFDTYDTMWRAHHIFGVENAVVVTQKFHLSRAVYLARVFDIDAIGVEADKQPYRDAERLWIREQFARVKAVGNVLLKSEGSVGGPPIPLSNDGRVTWDEGV